MKKLYIQSMTCLSCTEVFKNELVKLDIEYIYVIPPEAETKYELSDELYNTLDVNIHVPGMALIKDKDEIFAEKVCIVLIALLNEEEGLTNEIFSYSIKRKMQYSYKYVSNKFNKAKKITPQDYYIKLKTEKAKLLIIEGVMSIDDIAHDLHYNYTSYFSKQFKEETGISPSNYKNHDDLK